MNRHEEFAKEAARHHSTLNAFAAVVAILEGGFVYDPAAHKAAQRIIAIAKDEESRQLRKYDKQLAKLKGSP